MDSINLSNKKGDNTKSQLFKLYYFVAYPTLVKYQTVNHAIIIKKFKYNKLKRIKGYYQ